MEADRMDIETPEHVRLSYEIAGLGSRFLAALMDQILQVVIFLLLVFGLAGGAQVWPRLAPSASAMTFVLAGSAVFLFVGYFVFFEMLWNGQSPGKRQASIRVIRDDGTPITITESLLRNVLRILDFLPVYYGVGVVSILLSKQSKRIGDFVAGTVVVREHPDEDVTVPPPPAPAQDELVANLAPLLGRLDEREVTAVEQFMARRDELAPPLRHSLSLEITAALQASLGTLPAALPSDPERFLEVVYLALVKQRERY